MPLLQIYSFLLPALRDSSDFVDLLGFSAAACGLYSEIFLSSQQASEVDSHSSLAVPGYRAWHTLGGVPRPLADSSPNLETSLEPAHSKTTSNPTLTLILLKTAFSPKINEK